MRKYDFYSDTIANLALISFVYAQFINANNTIAFIHDLTRGMGDVHALLKWLFGVLMVFFTSWITLMFNLHFLPKLYSKSEKHQWVKAILGNILLYTSFVLVFYFSAQYFYAFDSEKVVPHFFGWTVVYVISMLIYNAIRHQRISKLEQKEKEILITEKLKSELNEIKAVINPHFLFNSLNTLNALIKIDANKASKFTTHLSRLYRYILSNRNKDLITLQEELFFINDYVQLIKIRYKNCFNVEVDIAEQHLGYLIPPLSLQLLIENAEKHNSFTEESPLFVTVSVENEYLVVSHPLMERTGHVNSTGNGLSSLTKRCRILFKRDLHIIRNKNFTVKVPLLKSMIKNK